MTQDFVIQQGPTEWHFDTEFLNSNWQCIWGKGCKGILDDPAEELGHGCCSVGTQMTNQDEARLTSALAAVIPPHLFENTPELEQGVFSDDSRTATRVVNGVCIFHNSADFPGGAGCALHLAAIDAGESPSDWKPAACWQLPIKLDETPDGSVVHVRRWSRKEWGSGGETMAWCCTEEPETYTAKTPVIDSLSDELGRLLGDELYDEVRVELIKRRNARESS